MASVINVTEIIDRPVLAPFQKRVAMLCSAIVFVEGFNTQLPGYIAPALARDWQLTPAQMTSFFAAGLFGLLLGALFVAPIADKIGRRPLLLACVPFLAVCAILTAFSPSLVMLDIARFLTGLGIGGAMPNAIALTSEYSPHRRRALLVALMFTGFVLGAFAVGLVSSWLVPVFGWQSVFVIGGMLGGMFCGLIAPNIFNWVAEYPLLIVLSLLCRPGAATSSSWRTRSTGPRWRR